MTVDPNQPEHPADRTSGWPLPEAKDPDGSSPVMVAFATGSATIDQYSGPVYNKYDYYGVLTGRHPDPAALAVASDHIFVPPSGFLDAQKKVAENGVIVLHGPAGIGKRTSGLALLRKFATTSSPTLELVVLEPEWDLPNTSRLPGAAGHGYLLDLSEEDVIPRAFAENLVSVGVALRAIGSVLVVLALDHIWKPLLREASSLDPISVSWAAPLPKAVAASHLRHLNGRDELPHDIGGVPIDDLLPRHAPPQRARRLAAVIAGTEPGEERQRQVRELTQWIDYVEKCFGCEATYWSRAVLWSVAALDGAGKKTIVSAARELLGKLKININPAASFIAIDLTTALKQFEAYIVEDCVSVSRDRHGADQAIINHIYTEFPDLRDHLLSWLVSLPATPGVGVEYLEMIGSRLHALALQVGATEVLNQATAWLKESPRSQPLVEHLLEEAALDHVLSTYARQILMDWAKSSVEAQRQVAARVCSGRFGVKQTERALVRLKWLANQDDATAASAAGDALRRLGATNEALRNAVLTGVVDWFERWPRAAVNGFTQLVTVKEDSAEFIRAMLQDAARPQHPVRELLLAAWRIVLTQPRSDMRVIDALLSWITAADRGDLDPDLVHDVIRDAAVLQLRRQGIIPILLAVQSQGPSVTCERLIDGLFEMALARQAESRG